MKNKDKFKWQCGIIVAAILVLGLAPFADAAPVKTYSGHVGGGTAATRWAVSSAGQVLHYASPVEISSLDIHRQSGSTANVRLQIYGDYDGAGTYGGLIHEEVVSLPINNAWNTGITLSSTVQLWGEPDGLYYLRFTSNDATDLHVWNQDGDDGSDPLRHGAANGYIENDGSIWSGTDYRLLNVWTEDIAPTFKTGSSGTPHWSQGWVAQGLDYSASVDGVLIRQMKILLKDGMTDNKALIEFYRDYDDAGNFSGLAYSEEVTTPSMNNQFTHVFASPVPLLYDDDNIFYMKISPADGGEIHAFYLGSDNQSDPNRHGWTGKLYRSADLNGSTAEDLAYLELYTSVGTEYDGDVDLDGDVDIDDLDEMSEEWVNCNDPNRAECTD